YGAPEHCPHGPGSYPRMSFRRSTQSALNKSGKMRAGKSARCAAEHAVEPLGLRRRLHAKHGRKLLAAAPVSTQRLVALPGRVLTQHQPAINFLGKWIELDRSLI